MCVSQTMDGVLDYCDIDMHSLHKQKSYEHKMSKLCGFGKVLVCILRSHLKVAVSYHRQVSLGFLAL